jgi:hypothetical protein
MTLVNCIGIVATPDQQPSTYSLRFPIICRFGHNLMYQGVNNWDVYFLLCPY